MRLYRSCQDHLTLGAVLDGKYCLISELSAIDGRPRFIAEDLINNREVELVILAGAGANGPRGYNIRPRASNNNAHESQVNERAQSRFAERIVLTGVSVRENDRLVYSAWDRKRGKAVRVIVEDID